MQTERIVTPRGTFAYVARGEVGAPVVLCLHGFPDVATTFAPLLESLAEAGYRAVAPFLRGYAPSILTGPYHPEALADDAVALADAFSPDQPVCLVGHDWGAVATYGALASRPDRFRRAVTMAVPHPVAFVRNALAGGRDFARSLGSLRAAKVDFQALAQLRRSWYMGAFQLPFAAALLRRDGGALIDRLWRDWSPGFTPPPGHLAEVKRAIFDGLPTPAAVAYYREAARPLGPAWRRLRDAASPSRRIQVPTLLLMGANDGCVGPLLGAGQEAYFAAGFRQETIAGVGHFLHLEAPEIIAAHVRSFLAR